MGIFDKLFGKKVEKQDIEERSTREFNLAPSSEMLDEEIYWNIVDLSFKQSNSLKSQESILIKQIQKLTPHEMIGFRLRTDKLLFDTYKSELWCAAYLMNGGCSDDAFEYFRNWLISRGSETFNKVKEDPDLLIYEYDEGIEFYEFEDFWYVALEAFKNITDRLFVAHILMKICWKNDGRTKVACPMKK